MKQQQEADSVSFPSDSLKYNQNDYLKHRRVEDVARINDRSISEADEEIEKFEKQFVCKLETSFDDSGYDPGSIVGDTDSVVNVPPTKKDSQNSRGNIEDFNQVFQYENISVRLSSQVNSSPYIKYRVSSPSMGSD